MNMTETRKRVLSVAAVAVVAFVAGVFAASVVSWSGRERPIEQGRISYLARSRFDTRIETQVKDKPEQWGYGWLYPDYLVYESAIGKKRHVVPRENIEGLVFE